MASTERRTGDAERARRELRDLTELLVGSGGAESRGPESAPRTWLLSTSRDEAGSLLAGQLLARIPARVRLIRPEEESEPGVLAGDTRDTLLWLRPGASWALRAASLAADGAVAALAPGRCAGEALATLRQSLPAGRLIELRVGAPGFAERGGAAGGVRERVDSHDSSQPERLRAAPELSWSPGETLPEALIDHLARLPPRGVPLEWALAQLKQVLF